MFFFSDHTPANDHLYGWDMGALKITEYSRFMKVMFLSMADIYSFNMWKP